jgi:hypothetical protein
MCGATMALNCCLVSGDTVVIAISRIDESRNERTRRAIVPSYFQKSARKAKLTFVIAIGIEDMSQSPTRIIKNVS